METIGYFRCSLQGRPKGIYRPCTQRIYHTIHLDVKDELFAGDVHVIDFGCRRQKRVVRSTFSAEINAAIDSLECRFLVQLAYCEITHWELFQDKDQLSNMVICDRFRKLPETGQL